VIPCAYQLVDADIASWSLLASSEKLCLPLLADDAEAEVFEDCTLSEDFVSSTTDVESASDSMDASSAEDGSWNTIENEFGPTANPVEDHQEKHGQDLGDFAELHRGGQLKDKLPN